MSKAETSLNLFEEALERAVLPLDPLKTPAMQPHIPFSPVVFPFYYGWVILAASTVGLVMSALG